ncbi:OmpP1/FadL family transporter [Bacterioplanoides sp. SCSIO 12839]|uniref:OmpP1/FadL family transporter n=1 Tax=Bacterioplanoides sp. SCSIO 12839 TaxID=2829569 RepID=UPI002105BD4B|nr:outer membrane protein transport protein [Bacterioplanoides sp. SCSIO 12839]UTW48978.1 TonB-dependent receptor [Bacterioplanoides sp. SCSIO 12839]
MTKIKILAAAMAAIAASQGHTQGFYVDEQSAIRLGDAFSAGAAAISDASVAAYNPAAMLATQEELAINLSAISVQSEFKGDATTLNNTPIQGKKAEANNFDLLPTLYFVTHLDESLAMGAFINAPYATGTDFGDDSVARYAVTESEITGIDAGVSFAFQATETTSFGFSIISQYLNAKTAAAINLTAACLAEAPEAICAATGVPASELGDTTHDGQFEIEGNDVAFAFAAGVFTDFQNGGRLGLNYRTRVVHDIKGTAKVSFKESTNRFVELAGLENTTAQGKVQITTPETANISYSHEFGKLTLQSDVQWTKWSRFDQIKIESSNSTVSALTAIPQEHNWEESFRFSLGANYALSEQLTLRTGIALDQTPIPTETAKVDFAFDDYKAMSIGMSYQLTEDLALDAGYQHTLAQERAITQDELASTGSRLQGDVSNDINSFALGLRWAM